MKLILVIFVILFLTACYGRTPHKTGLEGRPMPSTDLLLADSSTHLNSNNIPTDKPIVIFLFGPHCPYSHAQMKEIIQDMENLKNIRFYILTSTPFSQMKEFYEHYQLKKYSNIVSGVDYNHSFADYFEIPGVPYLAIYGKNKKMKAAFVGKTLSRHIKEAAEK